MNRSQTKNSGTEMGSRKVNFGIHNLAEYWRYYGNTTQTGLLDNSSYDELGR